MRAPVCTETNKTKKKKKKTSWQSSLLFLCLQKRLVKLDLPHTWLSPPPPSIPLRLSLPPSLGSKSLRGTDTTSTIHHSSRCDSQTALLSWLNCGHASYAGGDLHLCSVIHPQGIESSNPISRSPKCCPGETDRGGGGKEGGGRSSATIGSGLQPGASHRRTRGTVLKVWGAGGGERKEERLRLRGS